MVLMKVRPEFLKLLRDGIKKNEYRLNHSKYNDLKIGDIVRLVSDIDPLDYVDKRIKDIKVYNNWTDALMNNFEADFNGLFCSLNEVLTKVSDFYTEQEVYKYGIKVFSLEDIIWKR